MLPRPLPLLLLELRHRRDIELDCRRRATLPDVAVVTAMAMEMEMAAVGLRLEGDAAAIVLVDGPPVAARAGPRAQAAPAGAARRSVRRSSERVRSAAVAAAVRILVVLPARIATVPVGRSRPIDLPTDSSRRDVLVSSLVGVAEASGEAGRASEAEAEGAGEEVERRLLLPLVVRHVGPVLLGADRQSEGVAIAACTAAEAVTAMAPASRLFGILRLFTGCCNLGWTRAAVARALLAVVAAEIKQINNKGGQNRRPDP